MGVKSFYNKNKKYVILLLICLTVQMIYGINIYQDATSTIIDFFVRLIINTLLLNKHTEKKKLFQTTKAADNLWCLVRK